MLWYCLHLLLLLFTLRIYWCIIYRSICFGASVNSAWVWAPSPPIYVTWGSQFLCKVAMIITELIELLWCLNELMQIKCLAPCLTDSYYRTPLCYHVGTGGGRTNQRNPGHVFELKKKTKQVAKLAHEYDPFCEKLFYLYIDMYIYASRDVRRDGWPNVIVVIPGYQKLCFLLYGWKRALLFFEQEN